MFYVKMYCPLFIRHFVEESEMDSFFVIKRNIDITISTPLHHRLILPVLRIAKNRQ